jgi:hypothetical protein
VTVGGDSVRKGVELPRTEARADDPADRARRPPTASTAPGCGGTCRSADLARPPLPARRPPGVGRGWEEHNG